MDHLLRLARTRSIRTVTIILLFSLTVAAARGSFRLNDAIGGTAHAHRPNVLIILMDDQRSGGGSLAAMPKTRRWFRKGKRFSNFFVTTPLCCPSRSSILTGRYAHNHGVKQNSEANHLDPRSTIERYLHDAGYFTGIAGKYLNRWKPTEPPPYFDRSALISDENQYENVYYDFRAGVDGRAIDYAGLSPYDKYSTHFLSDHALGFLRSWHRRDSTRPWFLYVAPYSPHPPYQPEPKYENAPIPRWRPDPAVGERDRSDKPDWVRRSHVELGEASSIRAQQLRTLKSADDMVGRIFRRLLKQHDLGNTMVFFLSDNGFFWGEHGLEKKSQPYIQAVHVPMMMRWPGHVRGRRATRLTANIDLAPAILSATGIQPSPQFPMDGKSLLTKNTRRRLLLEYWKGGWEPLHVPRWLSTLTADSQYIQYYKHSKVIFREYYNLRKDPWELHNLLRDGDPSNDPNVRALASVLRRERTCVGSQCP
ncbi:MAG: sulfatase [Actinomycetota bacterium]|nr:sulfatase [Actinomycetota bacterium]